MEQDELDMIVNDLIDGQGTVSEIVTVDYVAFDRLPACLLEEVVE